MNLRLNFYNWCRVPINRFLDRSHDRFQLEQGDTVDICHYVRNGIAGFFASLFYLCYYGLLLFIVAQPLMIFGAGYAAIGFGWLLLWVSGFVAIITFMAWMIKRSDDRPSKPVSTEPSLFKVWYTSVKEKTCTYVKL